MQDLLLKGLKKKVRSLGWIIINKQRDGFVFPIDHTSIIFERKEQKVCVWTTNIFIVNRIDRLSRTIELEARAVALISLTNKIDLHLSRARFDWKECENDKYLIRARRDKQFCLCSVRLQTNQINCRKKSWRIHSKTWLNFSVNFPEFEKSRTWTASINRTKIKNNK